MHRRALLLAGLATLPAAARPAAAGAQRRRGTRQRASAEPASRSRRGGGLTAGHVRTRVVSRTFSSNLPLTIPAGAPGIATGPASPYPSTIQVGGFNHGRIRNVRVSLRGLTHTSPNELDILLVAPGNVGVILLSDAVDDDNVSNITLIFDQAAPGTPLEPLTSGVFQPKNGGPGFDPFPAPAPAGVSSHSLTTFTNRNPNGAWRLFIVDDGPNDTGSLNGWSLTIQARVRVPHRHGLRTNQRPAPQAKR